MPRLRNQGRKLTISRELQVKPVKLETVMLHIDVEYIFQLILCHDINITPG